MNEAPVSIDESYQNKVVKNDDELYILTIRDKINLDFAI